MKKSTIVFGIIACVLAYPVLGIVVFIANAVLHPDGDPIGRGKAISEQLRRELDGAKEVRVIEHSCRWDYENPNDEKDSDEKTYGTVVLNLAQRDQLKSVLAPAADKGAITSSACIFEPHHRIEVERANGSVFKVELCFQCGEMSVNGGYERILPEGWLEKLEDFTASLSLRPRADWRELVKSPAKN